jgi:NAD(P) transhydrogenase subunit alpha
VGSASELSGNASPLSAKAHASGAVKLVAEAGVDPFIFAITVFVLACFVGYYVVWKVTPALHTPLMSVTNAISSIIIVGAILAVASDEGSVSGNIGIVAIFIASINIFGGFIVTQRMLQMFRKK